MPKYHLNMFEGRTIDQKRRLVEEVTRVTVEVLGVAPESVDIQITELKRENWATAGKLMSDSAADVPPHRADCRRPPDPGSPPGPLH
jgi:4-oxalocrotonate tautomerase